MKVLRFPLLNEEQIEVRVGQVSAKGCTLLLYKTSRTDAEILDRVVGQGNWQKRFYTLQGVGVGDSVRSIVVCSVGIYDEDKHEWIWKDDSGTESQVEQDKGVCSDAFKRASGGSCWGIGRELYYTGFIFVKVPTQPKSNGKGYELADRFQTFEVQEISWNENPLSLKSLVIIDNNGSVVFSKGSKAKVPQTSEKAPKKDVLAEASKGIADSFVPQQEITQATKNKLTDIVGSYGKDKYERFKTYLQDNFLVESIGELSEDEGQKLLKALGGK